MRKQLGSLKTEILHGKQALIDIATAPEVTGVMCAIVGAAGLPSLRWWRRNTAKRFIWQTRKRWWFQAACLWKRQKNIARKSCRLRANIMRFSKCCRTIIQAA